MAGSGIVFRDSFSEWFFDADNFLGRIFRLPDIFEKRRKPEPVFSGAGACSVKIPALYIDTGPDQPWIQNRSGHRLIIKLGRVDSRLLFASRVADSGHLKIR